MTLKTLEVPERAPAELLLRHSIPAEGWQLADPYPMLRVGGMSPYRPTRREFLIGAAGLLVLAPFGCGGESGEGGETTSGGTHTIEHDLGTTEVPVNPQRVATLTQFGLEYALALDRPPVAAPGSETLEVDYLKRRRRELDAVSTGDATEPNVEAVAAQQPDLIVARSNYIEQIYDELSEIAPTVGLPVILDWKRTFRFFARVVGRQERAEEVLSAYEERVREVRAALGGREAAQSIEVSVVRGRTGGMLRLYVSDSFSGLILDEVGLSRPPSQDGTGGNREISLERIELADGDAIFVWTYSSDEAEAVGELREDPLWERLDAVQSNRAYFVGSHWYGTGPLSANLVLDDLERYLVQEGEGASEGSS